MESRTHGLIFVGTAAFMIFLFSLQSISGESGILGDRESDENERKMGALGSRPPDCVNKCYGCRPCFAALVIISQQRTAKSFDFGASSSSVEGEGDGYYPLSWECRCGDKLFKP